MAETSEPKWEGKTSVDLNDLTADQVWLPIADFCNIHKWFPNLAVCNQVEGELGKPGLVRFCESLPQPSPDGSGESVVLWAKEKLVMIDHDERCLSYEIFESSMGFKSYVATFKVLEINGDGERGSKIEWSFTSEAVEGWKLEDFKAYVNSVLQFMAKKIEDAASSVSA